MSPQSGTQFSGEATTSKLLDYLQDVGGPESYNLRPSDVDVYRLSDEMRGEDYQRGLVRFALSYVGERGDVLLQMYRRARCIVGL